MEDLGLEVIPEQNKNNNNLSSLAKSIESHAKKKNI